MKWKLGLIKYEEILLEGSVVTSDCTTGLPRLWYEITGEYGLCEEALKAEESFTRVGQADSNNFYLVVYWSIQLSVRV